MARLEKTCVLKTKIIYYHQKQIKSMKFCRLKEQKINSLFYWGKVLYTFLTQKFYNLNSN